MQNSGAFVEHLLADVTFLYPISSTVAANDHSLPLHSSHTLYTASLLYIGTPFHLPVSFCKGADPPLNIISILLWFFSCTFQHLPLRPFTYTAFKTQSLGLLPRSSVQSFSIHLHAILLSSSLRCLPETPARVAQLQSCKPKASKQIPIFPIYPLASSRCHESHIGQSLYQTLVIMLICQFSVSEPNAP